MFLFSVGCALPEHTPKFNIEIPSQLLSDCCGKFSNVPQLANNVLCFVEVVEFVWQIQQYSLTRKQCVVLCRSSRICPSAGQKFVTGSNSGDIPMGYLPTWDLCSIRLFPMG